MADLTHDQRVAREKKIIEHEDSDFEKELSYPVRKSNDMIQKSRYSLSLREQRLLLYIISKIKTDDTGEERYKVSFKDAVKICGASDKGGLAYNIVFEAFATLRDKGFTIYTKKGRVQCAFIEHPEQDGDGNMEYNFDPYVVPYLFQVKKRFTQYDLGIAIRMKSIYGIRLYELLKSYSNLKTKRFTLEELRERLDADTASYKKNYGLFKKYVLEPALKDIETSDLRVSYIEIKEGRKVVAIDFVITEDVMAYYERGLLDSGK